MKKAAGLIFAILTFQVDFKSDKTEIAKRKKDKIVVCLSERQTRKRTQESNVIMVDWTSDDDGCDVDDLNPVFKRKATRNSGFGDDGFSVEITRIPKNAKSESRPKVGE